MFDRYPWLKKPSAIIIHDEMKIHNPYQHHWQSMMLDSFLRTAWYDKGDIPVARAVAVALS